MQAVQVVEGEVEEVAVEEVAVGMDTTATMVPMVRTALPVVALLTEATPEIQEVLVEVGAAAEGAVEAVDLSAMAA